MPKLMLTIAWEGGKPTIDQIRERFGVEAGMLDETFGVIASSPDAEVYTVLLDERELSKFADGPYADTVRGPPRQA